jgi:hypothetical protein
VRFAGVALFGEEPVLWVGGAAEKTVGGLVRWADGEGLMKAWRCLVVCYNEFGNWRRTFIYGI